jgi:hypothetical protein
VASNRSNLRAARERKGTALAITFILVLLLVGLGLALASGRGRSTDPDAEDARVASASAVDALDVSGSRRDPTDDARSAAPAPALETVAAAPTSAEPADPGAEERATLRRRLTSAIELSVAGALDPTAIVRAGLSLVQLHLAKDDLPTTAPDGSLRYPLAGCPPGVRAELWVARSSATKDANVLSLRVELDAPAEPYLLVGAVRKAPIVYLQAFLDAAGAMKDFVLLTDIAPSGASRSFGLSLSDGRVPQGIVFHADMSRPSEWKAQSYGLEGGADGSWDDPIALLGEPWPETAEIAELGNGLLGLLSEARR